MGYRNGIEIRVDSICLTKYSFSKLVYAEVSKITGASKQVFHQTVNAQNSMLTKEIHDQGKINLILKLKYLLVAIY